MSGICGLVHLDGSPVEAALLERMVRAAAHRGPEGVGLRFLEGAGLAHLALHATVETTTERQPVSDSGERLYLVADARIDNRSELISELRTCGLLDDREPGEAALILAAWLRWGDACVDRLVGDFAFALWDRRERRLLCARDPIGVRPLCYARIGPWLAFASEAQQILQVPGTSGQLDEVVLGEYLAACPQSPQRSFFRDVSRLPPGHRLTIGSAGLRVERYWEPGAGRAVLYQDFEDYAGHVREILQRAVSDRLRTAGPVVGISLSGGLDSGSMATLAKATSGAPQVLGATFVFDQLQQCDERSYVQSLARDIDLDVTWIPAERHWLLSDSDTHPPDLESPFIGWQSCHRQTLEQLASRGARVLLTGHGADDLLRGSSRIYADRLCRGNLGVVREVWQQADAGSHWKALYRFLLRPLLPPEVDRATRRLAGRTTPPPLPDWLAPDFVHRTDLKERIRGLAARGRLGRLAEAQIRGVAVGLTGYEQAVHWHDRHAAAWGIDVRHPFLDRRLFDLVLAIPPEQLHRLGTSKPLLRNAMAGLLPDTVRLRQDKTTFDSYLAFSLEKEAGRVEELLRNSKVSAMGLVDGDRLRVAFEQLRTGTLGGMRRTLWFAITLEIWLRRYGEVFARAATSNEDSLWSAA